MIDPGLQRRNLAGTVSVGDTGRKLRRSVTCDAVTGAMATPAGP